jgi:hypothetical protein
MLGRNGHLQPLPAVAGGQSLPAIQRLGGLVNAGGPGLTLGKANGRNAASEFPLGKSRRKITRRSDKSQYLANAPLRSNRMSDCVKEKTKG